MITQLCDRCKREYSIEGDEEIEALFGQEQICPDCIEDSKDIDEEMTFSSMDRF